MKDPSRLGGERASIADDLKGDETGSAPVILLGDLESSSEESAFTGAGLTDSFSLRTPLPAHPAPTRSR